MTHEALRRTALAGPALPAPAPPDPAAVRRRPALSAVAGSAQAGRRAAAQARPRRFGFEKAAAGARPPGFAFAPTGGGGPGRRAVVEGPPSPAGPKVPAETSEDRAGDRFPLAVLEGMEARGVALSARFRPVSGAVVGQAAGPVARPRDPRNHCTARANALEDNVRLCRVADGRRVQFAGADVRAPRDRWGTPGPRVEGDRFAAALDGRALSTAAGRTFADAGRVGFWTEADSLTHLDGLDVEAPR